MKYHRCWCQHTWPVLLGPNCTTCGRMSEFPVFAKEKIAEGIVDEHIEGGGTVRMVEVSKVQRGTYGGMYVGPVHGAAWETWCAEHGF
jgi:hypothetical protein